MSPAVAGPAAAPPRPTAGAGPRPTVLLLGLLLALAALAAVLLWPRSPGDNSAEAGFARDMSEHHAQAVAMSLTTLEASQDEQVSTLAYDVATTQSNQIGQMEAWLRFWDLPLARVSDRMEWMGDSVPTHPVHTGEGAAPQPSETRAETVTDPGSPDYRPMPGMASRTELNELADAQGEAADVLYLQLMITHHIAGAEMARAALEVSADPQVTALATAMAAGQRSEIDVMQTLLVERGAAPREDLTALGF